MFDPVLVGRSWVSAAKSVPLAKLWGVAKKRISHNFENRASLRKSLLPIDCGKRRSALRGEDQFRKLCGYDLLLTPLIFANGPHLVALTPLRATNTGSRNFFVPPLHIIFWILLDLYLWPVTYINCIIIAEMLIVTPAAWPLLVTGWMEVSS